MTHPDLEPGAIEGLRTELGLAAPPGRTSEAPAPDASAPEARAPRANARVKAMARRAMERVAASSAGNRALNAVASRGAVYTEPHREAETNRLAVEVALLSARLEALVPALHALQNLGSGAEIVAGSADLQGQLRGFDVNQELFKAELAEFRAQLEGLGQAIAPAAGLPGVAIRFAELRERVNALDRRARSTAEPAAPRSAIEPGATAHVEPAAGTEFDYVGFEHRFRGDSAVILPILESRYLELLESNQPVLDFGCGRGELVAALRNHGIDAVGVDPDRGMVDEAQAKGLPVEAADGIAWLRDQPEGSLGSIISVHVVEHLELPVLVEFLDLASSRLRPGGLLVAETPNPASLVVLGNSYILDPTHVWPLHPSLLTFLCERAGFRSVEQRYYSPAEGYHLPLVDMHEDVPPWAATINQAFTQINDTVFGPQEYAVLATTPTASRADLETDD